MCRTRIGRGNCSRGIPAIRHWSSSADWFTGYYDPGRLRCGGKNKIPTYPEFEAVKLEFHNTDTDTNTVISARILADTSDTRDSLKLFPWQAERHADILSTVLARMSTVSVSASASRIIP